MEIVSLVIGRCRFWLAERCSYLVYIGILAVYLVFAYFMYPETKHRTMEEVAVIFDYGRREGRQKALELMAQHQAQQEMQEGGDNSKIDVDHSEVA